MATVGKLVRRTTTVETFADEELPRELEELELGDTDADEDLDDAPRPLKVQKASPRRR